jgi:hypothetical protein
MHARDVLFSFVECPRVLLLLTLCGKSPDSTTKYELTTVQTPTLRDPEAALIALSLTDRWSAPGLSHQIHMENVDSHA